MNIRPFDAADRPGICALDTSFETATVLDVVTSPRRIDLVERPSSPPLVKRYPIADAFAHWATWDVGFVAEDSQIWGFAAVEYEAWHSRLVLWHLYVGKARRREGIGRALLERVEAYGVKCGARRVWLETSNVNVPGIGAYERLGYELCGVDTTLYDTLDYEAEKAVYLAKRI
jgi:ribosomal protein S18 acetylase RimI-like enzyme